MENGTKKQELFNWFFCTFVSCFSHFQNAVFSIFSKCIFKTHFFDFFTCFVWKCAWKTWKNCVLKMWKKNAKQMWNKCWKKHMWTSSWEGGTLIFLGPVLLQLLPAQLLQVENRRGAVQIDRKWTVQIADLFNISIAKQWLPGAKT